MDKEDLIKNIKGWIHIDEEIKDLQRQIKEKRNEKKQNTETLVKIMREQSNLHDSTFLLTSHSSTVLNACYPEEIITVEATEKGTIVDKIKNKSEIDDFLNNSNFRLGDLWVSGGLGAIPQ